MLRIATLNENWDQIAFVLENEIFESVNCLLCTFLCVIFLCIFLCSDFFPGVFYILIFQTFFHTVYLSKEIFALIICKTFFSHLLFKKNRAYYFFLILFFTQTYISTKIIFNEICLFLESHPPHKDTLSAYPWHWENPLGVSPFSSLE